MARSSSSLFVSWKEPDEDKKNGIITNYTVCISRFEAGECFEEYITGGKSLIIANLNYTTKYFVRVRASTKAGSGHFSGSQHQFTNGSKLKRFFKSNWNIFVDKSNFYHCLIYHFE